MSRLCLPLLVLLTAGLFAFPRERPAAEETPTVPAARDFRLQGTASCAAAACHNGNGPRGALRSEYTTWAAYDPHARAFEALLDDRSRTITANLRKQDEKTPPAEENALCLNCHVHSGARTLGAEKEAPRHERFSLQDGVGCESCHGPAEKWLSEHYSPAWRARSSEEKAALGLWPTKNLTARAELCAGCHVGHNGRDVNHDLTAAGHPRLSFELSAYHATLPKHWDVRKDTQGRPAFDAELWSIGQVVSARAALALLRDRVAGPDRPWPELAEHDCFACHHDLTDQKWRRDPARVKGRLGSPEWGTWYFAEADVVSRNPPRPGLAYPEKPLGELRRLMRLPDADRRRVGDEAGRAADALAGWVEALREKGYAGDAAALARALDARKKELPGYGWDRAAQLYLALAAQAPEAGRKEFLLKLRKDLEFAPGYDSPRGFGPRRFENK